METVESTLPPEPRTQRGFWGSTVKTILQVVAFQAVLRYFITPSKPPAPDEPSLLNILTPGDSFDVFFHISENWVDGSWDNIIENSTFVHGVTDVYTYEYFRRQHPFDIEYTPSENWDFHDAKIRKNTQNSEEINANNQNSEELNANNQNSEEINANNQNSEEINANNQNSEELNANNQNNDKKENNQNNDKKVVQFKDKIKPRVYLITTIVPHTSYIERPESLKELCTRGEEWKCGDIGKIDLKDLKIKNSKIANNENILRDVENIIIDYEEFSTNDLQSLLDNNPLGDSYEPVETVIGKKSLHWRGRLDVGLIADEASIYPSLSQIPRRGFPTGVFHPHIDTTDFWMLQKDYAQLSNLEDKISPLKATIYYNIISPRYCTLMHQLTASFKQQRKLQLQGRREAFMLKKILLDTNPIMLIFSVLFILCHTVFSFFALKNEVQFWYRNESMQGISALSLIFNFGCELVIGLYLYDSGNTSWMILSEIFIGIAISAWKVTKAVKFTLKSTFPYVSVNSGKNYIESHTNQYDRIAIKYMSLALLPLGAGYAVYALYYYKYKSWYSYILSVLAGVVYTFGFIMMTPQLYINYRLKSVDHLPWKALIYKSLNTFVDDIGSFLIDMPWMHRLSCFRDDIIFFAYLYQRYIYRVDSKRQQEWMGKPIDENIDPNEIEGEKKSEKSKEIEGTKESGKSKKIEKNTNKSKEIEDVKSRKTQNDTNENKKKNIDEQNNGKNDENTSDETTLRKRK